MKLKKYIKRLILTGIIALIVLSIGTYALGDLSGYEAKDLFKKSISGINMLSNTIILASATILALLLTTLGISTDLNDKLSDEHYKHLLLVAKFDTIVLITALLSFVLFNLPIAEGDNVPQNWYSIIYYITLGISSVLGASLTVVVLMLYNTVVSMIKSIGLGKMNIYAESDDNDS
tara:strand:- start:22225 stop:22752 length:528 start_codon:yes stop_codon:yes gene_type:complete